MNRVRLLAFAAALTSFSAAAPAPAWAQTIEVEFIGNAAVRISDGGRTFVTDFPYESGYSGYMSYDFERARPRGPVTALITHRHRDHFDPGLFQGTGWTYIGPADDEAAPDRVSTQPEIIRAGNATVEVYATPHARIPHRSYILRWHGYSFFFPGDTEDARVIEVASGVDFMFVTPWLLQNAERDRRRLSAGRIILYHHHPGDTVGCASCEVPAQGTRLQLPAR